MTFDVEIGGRSRLLTIEPVGPAGGRFRIVLRPGEDLDTGVASAAAPGGEIHEIDVRPTDLGLSLIYVASGRVVDIAVTERTGGEWLLQLPAVTVTAVVDGRLRRPGGDQAGPAGVQRIMAPMPGRVLRVLVQPGDDVRVRQGLVVIEAMKMENELIAPRAGRVRDVAVSAGSAVEAGRVLIVIE